MPKTVAAWEVHVMDNANNFCENLVAADSIVTQMGYWCRLLVDG